MYLSPILKGCMETEYIFLQMDLWLKDYSLNS